MEPQLLSKTRQSKALQILSLPLLSLQGTLQTNYHPETSVPIMSYQYTERQVQWQSQDARWLLIMVERLQPFQPTKSGVATFSPT